MTIEAADAEMGEKLKKKAGYYTLATGLNYNFGDNNDSNSITFENFSYTDKESKIETSHVVKSSEGKNYAISGEKVTITHTIWNGKQSSADIDDVLNLNNMKIDDGKENLGISDIKTGTDLNNLTPVSEDTRFDSNVPLKVICPKNQGKYYVQYEVSIPELEKYGKLSKLNCEVLLGQEGMSQISSSTAVDIRNKPALYAKKDSSQITDYQIIKVSSPSEVTKDMLWSELYSKAALDNSNEYKINVEDGVLMRCSLNGSIKSMVIK